MPYITDTERLAEQEGVKKGLTEGRREGQLQGLRKAVTDALEVRFGCVPSSLAAAVKGIDNEERLLALHRQAVTVSSLRDVKV